MPLSRYAVLLLVTGIMLACVSCSGRPPVYPVRGQVFYSGQPAAGALVILHPLEKGKSAPKPHGRVGADGSFTLNTYNTNDGAPPGRYAVTVHWRWQNDDDDEEEGNRLPARLASPATSGLQTEIHPGENQLPAFHLE
jgi:hypothetical protein